MEKENVREKEEVNVGETAGAMEAKNQPAKKPDHDRMEAGGYLRFALMLASSFVIMYLVMFLNAARFEHVYLSLMRLYMTILMVAPMAVVMLLFMRGMYKNQKINIGIIAGSILLFILTFYFVRTQALIGDRQWMRAMIPHHSSAILTSSEADLSDPEVKKLAEAIVKTQEEEIDLMKRLLEKTE